MSTQKLLLKGFHCFLSLNALRLRVQYFWHQMKIAWLTYSLFLGNVTISLTNTTDILFMLLYIDIAFGNKRKKVTNLANFWCSLRYCVTRGCSFLIYSTSDFHCFPSANTTSGSTISGMDGNSSNSGRILRYSSFVVVILPIGNDCFCAYFADVCIWYLMHKVL